MKRRHIAVFTFLMNAHMYPALGLCTELVNRGYRVTYATSDHYAHRVRETGAEPVVFRELKFENGEKMLPLPSSYDKNFFPLFISVFYPLMLASTVVALSQLDGYYNKNPPDLILYDRELFVGQILATRLGVPAIQLIPHFVYEDVVVREDGVLRNPEPILAFSQLLDSFLLAHGVKDKNNLWRAEKLNICFIPKEFQVNGDSFDERFCFVGPCLNRPVRSAWKNNSGGKPIVLISGSQADTDSKYFRTLIEALFGSKFHVVLSLGAVSEDSLGTILPGFEINKDADNIEILPHAILTICQAGMSTVMESLYHGVPVLAVPRTPVHAEVAYRVAELGLGVYLPELSMTIDAVKENVAKILEDTSLLNRVKNMQKVSRSSGGAGMAADRIERFLNRG